MSDDWQMAKASWKDSKPLGKAVQDFIFENVEWVLFLRRDQRFPCLDCYDFSRAAQRSDMSTCPNCWGTGVKITPTVIPCRLSRGDAQISFREGDFRVAPGFIDRFSVTGDVPRAIKPQLEDFLIVCEWPIATQRIGKEKQIKPLSFNSIYLVKQINDHYERELGWFNLGLRVFELDKEENSKPLLSAQNIEIMTEEKVRWSTKSYW